MGKEKYPSSYAGTLFRPGVEGHGGSRAGLPWKPAEKDFLLLSRHPRNQPLKTSKEA